MGTPYAELHAASAFSFLDGASLPEDLVEAAARKGLSSIALVDRNGVYGAPRFYKAAKERGLKPLVGAEVTLDLRPPGSQRPLSPSDKAVLNAHVEKPRLTLLVASRTGYRNLCRLLTDGALGRPKGQTMADWNQIALHSEGLHCLTGGDEGLLARALRGATPMENARRALDRLRAIFPGRLHVELQRHHRREEEFRNRQLVRLADELRLPLLATNGVRSATAEDNDLLDVLTCIRLGTTLDAAGRRLLVNRERRVKSPAEMAELFRDLPQALAHSVDLAQDLRFTLADLGYRFPDYPLPPKETPMSYLRRITWEGAQERFRPLHEKARAQIEKELKVIEKLNLAGYFLIVWDIVQFCRREKIMAQGRGSAANSAVCYALSITAVDPVKMDLLFERFLSEERGEWPDIDIDLPSGDQRERAIQYLYNKYGKHSAAMTANVITYRPRSAIRDVAKAFGLSLPQVDKLALEIGRLGMGEVRENPRLVPERLAAAGMDPQDKRLQHMIRMWVRILNLPRHLGQHSGGMVVSQGRLDDVCALEPASMENRVIIQWDKDDCADLGIVKVDLLGLGMLAALEECVPMILRHEGVKVDLAHLPPNDPATFRMINRADTMGVFQIESRAQMSSLPKTAPATFYDLVVQVAIIRPGPIVGGMAKPFFRRRRRLEKVTYLHPSLEPILKRTLGVPIFQEQVLRIAMVTAGFTGGEAEELRRAMGFKRSIDRMNTIEQRLRAGMEKRGIRGTVQDEIVKNITAFALYGFPESHAASFALIAYASAYLKAHHPAAFYASLLNAWPMGFYHPASLVKDAQFHNVDVRPIDVNFSGWNCRWERCEPRKSGIPSPLVGEGRERGTPAPERPLSPTLPHKGGGRQAFRLGLRFITGLRPALGDRIEAERYNGPFTSARDLARRCDLNEQTLAILADAGAMGSFTSSRRAALWQAARAARFDGPLFDADAAGDPSPLPEMSAMEETSADYRTSQMTTGPHIMTHLRDAMRRQGVCTTAELGKLREGQWVKTAGAVIVRQKPGTAKGFVFMTLEDETGTCQAIVQPRLYQSQRSLVIGAGGLIVEGVLQKSEGQMSVRAARFTALGLPEGVESHDFY